MRHFLAAAILALLHPGTDGAGPQSGMLTVGDPAPPLDVSRWIKGEKVDRLDPDQTYVVEFWATWCEPCRRSMPHLTQLQERYKTGATFLGISVWEPEPDRVEPFVRKMADGMGYRVAVDNVPADEAESRGRMADRWLTAAGEQGIPVAFLVKGGKVAWIGHPDALDGPLAGVVAGTWDIEAAARERREQKAGVARLETFLEGVMQHVREHQYPEAIRALDDEMKANPRFERQIRLAKVSVLVDSGADETLVALGSKLLASDWKDDPDALNYLALVVVVSDRRPPPSPDLLKLAMRAAGRANELKRGEDGRILDTLARVCFASGDPERAAGLEAKALGLADRDVPEWRGRLEAYRKAAAGSGR